jgi:hypothetical protein
MDQTMGIRDTIYSKYTFPPVEKPKDWIPILAMELQKVEDLLAMGWTNTGGKNLAERRKFLANKIFQIEQTISRS